MVEETLTSAQRRARIRVTTWALERLANPATVFLDTETTGVGKDAEIIDIGVVDLSGRALVDTLVAPAKPIPPESTRIHGIVDRDVDGAPSWGDLYPSLASLLRGRPIVVYNAAFDRRMVEGCCSAVGIQVETSEWHCAMWEYAAWAGVSSSHRRGRYRLHKLGDALASFDLPAGDHRALGDALACRSLVVALAGSDSSR